MSTDWKYTKYRPLRIFEAFAGYGSQAIALREAGIPFDLVGWSEIDRYAIRAHDAIFPEYAGRNFGDISGIDWAGVPDFDLLTYSSPCQDWLAAGLRKGGGGRQRDPLFAPVGVQEGDSGQEAEVPSSGERQEPRLKEVHAVLQALAGVAVVAGLRQLLAGA